eukprot:CAMPEP_0118882688 /NCGR_PEP_ID=MMETSP1163-20130328/21898_1 /TAXON_ID=124430 /ORGANISM="Phaeomonas parva, Strain CCMP2877" /LENGTH=67 /DNA_ID=CAMNT_0006819845 /DNA_START=162 /DNA_END=365 /DNA_ORIENTATION=+
MADGIRRRKGGDADSDLSASELRAKYSVPSNSKDFSTKTTATDQLLPLVGGFVAVFVVGMIVIYLMS